MKTPLLIILALVGQALSKRNLPTVRRNLSEVSAISARSDNSSTAPVPCAGNTPQTRTTWCNYTISTDYESVVLDTGVTREYWLDIDSIQATPDGVSRHVVAVNGTIPGPTLTADWGDNVIVHVTNHLDDIKNGTSIHWHGIRQNFTNQNDGVPSITQCPITPNNTMTYKWKAVQYGSSWYHSHIGVQAWEGVFGGIVINGPAAANYDQDLGMILLNDWTHNSAERDSLIAEDATPKPAGVRPGPPVLPNGLINGVNTFSQDNITSGWRFNKSVTYNTSYRLRLVNAAIDTNFNFSIDNHMLTVTATDFVPIQPFNTTVLGVAMGKYPIQVFDLAFIKTKFRPGQRYDVIVTADQSQANNDSFWMRADVAAGCSSANNNTDNIKGILYYGANISTPTSARNSDSQAADICLGDDLSRLSPLVSKNVGLPGWNKSENASWNPQGGSTMNKYRWLLDSTTMQAVWENPTLQQISTNTTYFNKSTGIIELESNGRWLKDEWVYLNITTTLAIMHPIHLHGHDFYILAQGDHGTWNGTASTQNPPRRDTAVLPGQGYLVIAFKTDNPGAWLLHCHVGYHLAEGFALQFIERRDEISGLIDTSSLNQNCGVWSQYSKANNLTSGDDTSHV